MRDAVDALFAIAALAVAIGLLPPGVPVRRFAVAAVIIIVAFAGWRAWSRTAGSSTHEQATAPACGASLARDPAPAVGALDDVRTAGAPAPLANGAALSSADDVVFSGWLAGFAGNAPGDSACVTVDGVVDARSTGRYGLPRPDVARALASPALLSSGFAIHLAAASLRRSVHRFGVVVVSGGKYRALPKTIAFEVR